MIPALNKTIWFKCTLNRTGFCARASLGGLASKDVFIPSIFSDHQCVTH